MLVLSWEKYRIRPSALHERFRVVAYSIRVLDGGIQVWYRCKLPEHFPPVPTTVNKSGSRTLRMLKDLKAYAEKVGVEVDNAYVPIAIGPLRPGDRHLSNIEFLVSPVYEAEEP